MSDERKIEELAQLLRQWLEQHRASLPEAFATFPVGACEITSCLLAMWLAENGEAGFVPFHHGIGTDEEHVCLVRGDLIVDITGDQFNWPPVIVTRVSRFHDQFYPVDHAPYPVMDTICRDLLQRAKPDLQMRDE